jgi:peptide/nickel transport system substrate-binding protein
MKHLGLLVSLIMITSLLAACATPTPEVIEKEVTREVEKVVTQVVKETVKETVIVEGTPQVVEKEVTKIVEVEVEKVVTAPPASQEPVVVLQGVDTTTLDPQVASSLPAVNILLHVFEALTAQNVKNEVVPALATEWAMLDDPTVWEFKMNPNATWADGEPVTANDVLFTWNRAANDPDNAPVGNTAYLLNIMNIVDVQVMDDHTVRIQTEQPNITLPLFINEFHIMPEHFYADLSREDASLQAMGSGPYVIKEWVKDDHLTTVLNENYWGDMPSIPEIVWRPVPEAATRLAELLSGGADIIANLPPDKMVDVSQVSGVHVKTVPTGRRIFIGLTQYNHPALQDKLVRQAFNYAVDFDAINKALLNGVGTREAVNVNPPWKNEDIEPYAYDPDKAKELLAEAGWTDSDGNGFVDKDGEELQLIIDSPNGRYIKDLEIAQAVGQYLRDAGVNAEVIPQEWSNYVSRLLADPPTLDDMYLIGSGSGFEGQSDIADLECNSSSNYALWCNDDFQTMFDELAGTLDMTRRKEILDEMQVLVKDEAPFIFLYFQVAFFGVSDRLENWQPFPNERIHLENITLK